MEITGYTVEEIKDPTGIIEGKRYEFLLDIEVDEDDELYRENGLELRVIFSSTESGNRIVQHFFIDKRTQEVLEFAMDEDEEAEVLEFCRTHMDVEDEGLL
jgi:hypothetical protein